MFRHVLSLCVLMLLLRCSPKEATQSTSLVRSRRALATCVALDGSLPTPHGTFSGDPDAIWLTEKPPDRRMCLTAEFTFEDPQHKIWRTPANYQVDGASIPRALWTAVGSPYTGDYRRASIVHDKACDDAHSDKPARRAADRMFFHACRAGGCSIRQATILYIGVRIGAWHSVVPAWNASIESEERGPEIDVPPADQRLLSDFQRIAQIVLSQPQSDDPTVIEGRVDGAASSVVGQNMREQ
jgi:hypothetical protein